MYFENNLAIPFVIPCNYTFLGEIDNEYLPIYDAPAGKHGFVIEKNGKLYFNDSKRARFWGIQTHRGGIIFDNETNEKIISRIIKHGYNLIKVSAPGWYWYNSSWRDWYDRFFAQMKEKGVYGYIQLAPIALINAMGTNDEAVDYYISNYGNFSNSTDFYSGTYPFKGNEFNICLYTLDKNITNFIKNWFNDILNHTNPYTGNKYKEEEAIVAIEITNENSLTEKWYRRLLTYNNSSIPSYYQNIFDEKWREWLKEKYNNNFTLLVETWDDGTGEVLNDAETNFSNLKRYPDFDNYKPWENIYSKSRTNDLGLFYMHLEKEFFSNISSYIKNKIGAKQLIVFTQSASNTFLFLDTVQKFPYSLNDFHNYYDLPVAHFYEKLVGDDFKRSCIENIDPFIKGWADPIFINFANFRIKDKPLSRSEVNWAFNNEYSYMFIPGLTAYAQLQDVDMVVTFSYMWQQHYDTPWYHEGRITGASSINPTPNVLRVHSNPAILIQNIIAYVSFMRKDIEEAKILEINYSKFFEKGIYDYLKVFTPRQFLENKKIIDESIGLIYKVEKNFNASNSTYSINYINKNETYSCNGVTFCYENRYLLVDNPYIKAIAGKLSNITLKNFAICPKYPSYGSIMFSSLTKDDIINSTKLLLTAIGGVANYGMQFESAGNYEIRWGDRPVMVEVINATIKIPLCNAKVYALNETGEIKKEIETRIEGNWLAFDIEGESILYEIVKEIDTNPPNTIIESGPSGIILNNNVTFTWDGIDDITPNDKLLFSYKLEGYDENWSNWTTIKSKTYVLPYGNYTFKVKARDLAGNEDESPATCSFTIAKTDYILITHRTKNEINDYNISTNFSFIAYSAAFNYTYGFIGFIEANWNCSGANASINATQGKSIKFNSGNENGIVILNIEYNGYNDSVIFKINSSLFSYMLYKGWNLIAIPNNWTAKTLGQNISYCVAISRWNGSIQKYESYLVGISPDEFDFAIENGRGYFIYIKNDTIFSVKDKITNFSIPLYVGWNLIGWFKNATMASLLAENITNCSIVSKWNAIVQQFYSYLVGISPDEFDFEIRKGMGIFVYIN